MENSFAYNYYSKLSLAEKKIYKKKIHKFLSCLKNDYPCFDTWYSHLFETDAVLNNNREIVFCNTNDEHLTGVIILKKKDCEKKICTIKVAEQYIRKGIGTELITRGIDWLKCSRPLITINSKHYSEYKAIFSKFDFHCAEAKCDYYKKGDTELVFNGKLK